MIGIQFVLLFACLFWGPLLATVATVITWAVRKRRSRREAGRSSAARPAPSLALVFWSSYILVVALIVALFYLTGASTSRP